jgi:hypothetical protein
MTLKDLLQWAKEDGAKWTDELFIVDKHGVFYTVLSIYRGDTKGVSFMDIEAEEGHLVGLWAKNKF